MAGSVQAYNIMVGQKHCLLIQDWNEPPVASLCATLRNIGFNTEFYGLPSGFASDWLADELNRRANATGSCFILYFSGCCLDKYRLTINLAPYDFHRVIEPFLNSATWNGKPKLFFFQVSHTKPMIPTDSNPIDPVNDEFPTNWTDFAVVRGGRNLTEAVQLTLQDDAKITGRDFRSDVVESIRKKYEELEGGVASDFFVTTRGLPRPLYLR